MRFCFEKKDFVDKNVASDKVAVIGEDFELTWKEFSQRVNKLCDEFCTHGFIDLKYPVIIYGHKSANMLVAIYAMMKLEINYIPMDIIYPKERIEKIIELSNCELLINTNSDKIEVNVEEILLKDDIIIIKEKTLINPVKREKSTDPLVYTIFTSGSTGDPKGVQISTEAVRSFTRWMTKDFGFTNNDVFVNSAVLSFDLSVFEVMTFGALGATLLLNNKECLSDPNLLMERITDNKGSVWVSTPSFALIYSKIENNLLLKTIHTFLFCGEVLLHGIAKDLILNYKNAKVINTYGPTEATVATTLIEIDSKIIDEFNPLPVGKSKRESQLLIDEGEIVIVGPNVSVGYLNNESLNKDKFILVNNQRAFKTGDTGYLKDGMLFFNGRNDDLVKLHGFRIELNEITANLNKIEGVVCAETIALKRNGMVKKIVSLVHLKSNLDISFLKEELAKTLPHYMIPSDIKIVKEIPLNNNGKSDKKLLEELYKTKKI